MPKSRRRIDLLHRLSRMREVEKQQAALRVAEAEGAHGKLRDLGARSMEIAASYSAKASTANGDALARQMHFLSGLETIRQQTENERQKAEETTQAAMAELRTAERRRELAHDRLGEERRSAERRKQSREASSSSKSGRNPSLARKLKGKG